MGPMERLGTWEHGEAGGADVVILVPEDEFPDEPTLSANAASKGLRVELGAAELAESGLQPPPEYPKLLVRTALIRPETYRPTMRRPTIDNMNAALGQLRHIAHYDQEHVVVLVLDAKLRLSAIHEAHIGTTSMALVEARHVLKVALMAGGVGIILAHNHPSGDPEPSQDDARLTAALEAAGRLMGVTLFDHMVIAADGFTTILDGMTYTWRGEGRRMPDDVIDTLRRDRARFAAVFEDQPGRLSSGMRPWSTKL